MLRKDELNDFGNCVEELLSFSPLFEDKLLDVELILNPHAGHFSKRRHFHKQLNVVHGFIEHLKRRDRKKKHIPSFRLHITEYSGHSLILGRMIRMQMEEDRETAKLIITAGGDGTHQEIMSQFIDASEPLFSRVCFFRLPLGTGNDAADTEDLEEACSIITEGGKIHRIAAVRVKPNGLPDCYAFNIASLGADAYITDLTNRLKDYFPGDVYKIFADMATVVYEPIYGVKEMAVEYNHEGDKKHIGGNMLLVAFGVSGRRTYGDHKKILPGEENLCLIENRPFTQKLVLKKLVFLGEHGKLSGVHSRRANSITIHYPGKLPLQMDGEAIWLEPDNFPVHMEILDQKLSVLGKV